jgi:hypothetical protein
MQRWHIILLAAALFFPFRSAWGEGNRNIVKVGSDATVEAGTTVYDAVAIGGSLTVRGRVEHDAVAIGGSVILSSGTVVGHNAVAVGGAIQRDAQSQVLGDVMEVGIPGASSAVSSARRTNWVRVFWIVKLVSFIGFVALVLVIAAVFPRQLDIVASTVEHALMHSVLWGVLGTVLIVPLAVLLAISIVGILLIPLEFVFILIAMVFGYVAIARFVGSKMVKAFGQAPLSLLVETLVGIFILFVIGIIPIVGWLVQWIVTFIGFGGVLSALFSRREQRAV